MAANNFGACLAVTLAHEGGYANHPADPGGPTMRGITQRTYDAWRRGRGLAPRSVRYITDIEIETIYRTAYWDAVHGDRLSAGVDLAVFDYAVNSGPQRALAAYAKLAGRAPVEIVRALCAERRAFLRGLATFGTFGRGWLRRVADIEAQATKMALATRPGAQPTKELADRAETARRAAGGHALGAIVAAALGSLADMLQGPVAAAALGLCATAVVVLLWRALIQRSRAKAYDDAVREGVQ